MCRSRVAGRAHEDPAAQFAGVRGGFDSAQEREAPRPRQRPTHQIPASIWPQRSFALMRSTVLKLLQPGSPLDSKLSPGGRLTHCGQPPNAGSPLWPPFKAAGRRDARSPPLRHGCARLRQRDAGRVLAGKAQHLDSCGGGPRTAW